VMDALECLYSRRVEHMNGCPGAELADLVHILVYWGAHNVLEQLALSSKKTLEVVLEKLGTTSVFAPEHGNLVEELIRHTSSMVFIFSQNDIQYISPTGPSVHAYLLSSFALLCKALFGNNSVVLEALDNKTLEAFCKFNILTMEQLLRRVNIDSDMIKVFRYIALWSSYDFTMRFADTTKLLHMFNPMYIVGVVHHYSKDPSLMIHSPDLVHVTPKDNGPISQEFKANLQIELTKIDRDSILMAYATPHRLTLNLAGHLDNLRKRYLDKLVI